jgi:hypothetical protein
MDLLVTTAYNPSCAIETLGRQIAAEFNVPFTVREKNSLATLKDNFGVSTLVVATQKGPIVHTPGGEYFFHLHMAELRIKNLKNGKHDHMITAMALEPGMAVLDCTLGLATDAIVASFITGSQGKIVGLEASTVIALVTKLGLQNFSSDDDSITASLQRICVENIDYHDYLTALPAQSFDVVFFDPMFRHPIYRSSNLKPLRYLADTRPLSLEALHQACRIAKKRVVVKEAQNSSEFRRLGISATVGGKYSSIHYGVIEAGG